MEARVRHLSAGIHGTGNQCPPDVSAAYRTAALLRDRLSAVCPPLYHLPSRGEPVMCPPMFVPIRFNCCFVAVPALAAAALLVQDLPPVSLLFVALPSHGLSVPRKDRSSASTRPPVPQHRRPLVPQGLRMPPLRGLSEGHVSPPWWPARRLRADVC